MEDTARIIQEGFAVFARSEAGKMYFQALVTMHETSVEQLLVETDQNAMFRIQGEIKAIRHIINLPQTLQQDVKGGLLDAS